MLGYLLLWSVDHLYQLLRKEPGVGQGDFKLLAALGAWGGWHLLPMTLLLASSIALLFSLPRYARTAAWSRTRLAFGSYLAVIGWCLLAWRIYLP
jgi:leader peptidase (prepilin peptidase)/N-methyltransferase